MSKETHIQRVDALISASGRSALQICKEAGVSSTALSNARSGSGNLRLETMEALAPVLGTDLPHLLGLPPSSGQPEGPGDLQRVPLDKLTRSDLNPRRTFDDPSLKELAASIAEQGLLQNLVVRAASDGSYVIVAGERRYRALIWLAEEMMLPDDIAQWGVPVRIITGDDAQHLALALLENLQRQDVNAMEEAEAFAKLQAIDPEQWRASHIAQKIGCSTRHVQQRLALVSRLVPEAQDALRAGKITFTHARALLLQTADKQTQDLNYALQSDVTATALHARITQGLIPTHRAIFPLNAYAGEIVEEGSTSYFRDKETFLAAQGEAVERRAEELRQIWAWCEIITTHYCSMWDISDQKSVDTQVAGARIHLHPQTGVVLEYTGLLKHVESEEDKRVREHEKAIAAAEAEEVQVFAEKLKNLIRERPNIAFAALLTNELYHLEGLKWIQASGIILKSLPILDDLEINPAAPESDLIPAVWERMIAAPRLDIFDASITAWIAERIRVPMRLGRDPLIKLIAATLDIPIPSCMIKEEDHG